MIHLNKMIVQFLVRGGDNHEKKIKRGPSICLVSLQLSLKRQLNR